MKYLCPYLCDCNTHDTGIYRSDCAVTYAREIFRWIELVAELQYIARCTADPAAREENWIKSSIGNWHQLCRN